MALKDYTEILVDGLWKKNPGLVQLLGLCPLLAVSNTATTALALGVAVIAVLTISNFIISLTRKIIIQEVRIIIYVVIIAAIVTCVQLLMEAYTPILYKKLGLYIALIVTNCIIIARAEMFAAKNSPFKSLLDGFANGLGFTLVLLLLGILREIIGQGTIFMGLEEFLGENGKYLTVRLFDESKGLLAAILPPGAFITLGLVLALKNFIDNGFERKLKAKRTKTTNLKLE
jgi:electron transport complex protein RnfE